MLSNNIQLKGTYEEIYRKLVDITFELEGKFQGSPQEDKRVLIYLLLGIGGGGILLVLGVINHWAFFIGATLVFIILIFVLLKLQYPEYLITSLKPLVEYNTLREVVKIISEFFPGEKMIITINTNYKTEKIIRAFQEKCEYYNFLGERYLIFPVEKINVKFSLQKWKIWLPSKELSLTLKSNIWIVSEMEETKKETARDRVKTSLQNRLIINRKEKKHSIFTLGWESKKRSTRIPTYLLIELKKPATLRTPLISILEEIMN